MEGREVDRVAAQPRLIAPVPRAADEELAALVDQQAPRPFVLVALQVLTRLEVEPEVNVYDDSVYLPFKPGSQGAGGGR